LKILIFLLAVLFGVWLWRRNRLSAQNRRAQQPEKTPPQDAQAPSALQPSPMLSCKHCGIHMPETDMVKGKAGVYCSQAHCQAAADQLA
jgi:uncharacterized protein